MAIIRSLLLVPDKGPKRCGAVEIAHELGEDIDNARVLGGCRNATAGILTKINSGICEDHIAQLDEEGAFVLEQT